MEQIGYSGSSPAALRVREPFVHIGLIGGMDRNEKRVQAPSLADNAFYIVEVN